MLQEQHVLHARQVAMTAHEGQSDKIGNPYFEHCRRVADLVRTDEERVVAYLHDVVEKASGWTIDRLKEEGFSQAVLTAVDALTRRPGEQEDDFIKRAIANPLAREVKRADLEDNFVQAEQAGLDTSKYERALALLDQTSHR